MKNEDMFLIGNEQIEEAIGKLYKDGSEESLKGVLEAIRERMHADGHFIFPVLTDENDSNVFAYRTVQTKDGKIWTAAFTSQEEYEKGAASEVLSYFIDSAMQACLASEVDGIIINAWGEFFLLAKELIEQIFAADGGVEYTVPDEPITPELLEDGTYLKRATEICNRNRTPLNMLKLAQILRDSWIWIPCNAVMSSADEETLLKAIEAAEIGEGLDSMIGQDFTTKDEVRVVPDILQNNEGFFFPVFTSAEEMGEYGEQFSKIQKHFLEAADLARNNEKELVGIVINAFSEPFVIPTDMFYLIAGMDSRIDETEAVTE